MVAETEFSQTDRLMACARRRLSNRTPYGYETLKSKSLIIFKFNESKLNTFKLDGASKRGFWIAITINFDGAVAGGPMAARIQLPFQNPNYFYPILCGAFSMSRTTTCLQVCNEW